MLFALPQSPSSVRTRSICRCSPILLAAPLCSRVLLEVREMFVQISADFRLQICAGAVEVADIIHATAQIFGWIGPEQWAAARNHVPTLEAQHHELQLRLLLNLHVCHEVLHER